MKAIITACMSLLFCKHVAAQSNFYQMSIGGGFGITQSFTEVKKHDFGLAGYGVLDYYFTPFISAGIEGQLGEVNGGNREKNPDHRQFINSYKTFSFNGKIALGALMDYDNNSFSNTLKGVYFGSGIGVIQNSVSNIKTAPDGSNFPVSYKSKDILIPLNAGINFYFRDRPGYVRYILNFNYQTNITLGEGLDGYDDSAIKFKNGSPDIYTYFSAGIRYQFGSMGLYKKSLF